MLWRLSFVCICGGLKEMSRLSELLNIQECLVQSMALAGAAHLRRAGTRSVPFAYQNRQNRSFLCFCWCKIPMDCWHWVPPSRPALPLTWLCRVAPSSAPGPQAAHLCLQEVVLEKLGFYRWFEFLSLGLTRGNEVCHRVFRNIQRRVVFFWSHWKNEEAQCCRALLVRSSKMRKQGSLQLSPRDWRVAFWLLEIHLLSWFQKPEHQRKYPMLYSLVIKIEGVSNTGTEESFSLKV